MAERLTPEERALIRSNIDAVAQATNPLTCRALLLLLEETQDRELEVRVLRAALRKLRDWHRSEYQSNPMIDAEVDAVLGATEPPIPTEVYYSVEHGNFYHLTTKKGMGQDFFNKWFERRGDFPKPPHS